MKTKGNWAKAARTSKLTVKELAVKLGITDRTIRNLRRKHGGPRSTDLAAWKPFLDGYAAMTGDPRLLDRLSPETQKLRVKLMQAKARCAEAVRKLRELKLRRELERSDADDGSQGRDMGRV